MRILLDESLPRDLGREIPGHDVRTVQQLGWAGVENGELLRRAAGKFDVLVTGDQSIEHQQNPVRLPLPVIILAAASNRMEALRPLIPELMQVLSGVRRPEFVRIPRPK